MSEEMSSDGYEVSDGIVLWNPDVLGNPPNSEPPDCVPHEANGGGKFPRTPPWELNAA